MTGPAQPVGSELAMQVYGSYKADSERGYGRAAGEFVTLLQDADIYYCHYPDTGEDGCPVVEQTPDGVYADIFAYHVQEICYCKSGCTLHTVPGFSVKVEVEMSGSEPSVHDLVKLDGQCVGNRPGAVAAFVKMLRDYSRPNIVWRGN